MGENQEKKPNDIGNSINTTATTIEEWMQKGQNLIIELNRIRSDVFESSNGKLEDHKNTISKLKAEYLDYGQESILEKIQKATNKITAIIDRSKKLSEFLDIDISECFINIEQDLKVLGENLVEHFLVAANEIVDNAFRNVENHFKVVTDCMDLILGYPSKLRNSVWSLTPIASLSECVAEIGTTLETVKSDIIGTVSEITILVNTLPSLLLKCVTEAVKKTEDDAFDILKNVAISVGAKFKNATITYLLEE